MTFDTTESEEENFSVRWSELHFIKYYFPTRAGGGCVQKLTKYKIGYFLLFSNLAFFANQNLAKFSCLLCLQHESQNIQFR